MKLPRYNSGGGGAPIQVGNNPSGGGTGEALASLGKDMMNALTTYGQNKVAQEAKLRDLDIYNKRSAASADVEMKMVKFMSDLQTDNNYGTFETRFQTAFKNAVNDATSLHFKGDEYGLSKAKNDFNLLKVEYYKNVLQKKNEKTISMAQMNYDNSKTNFQKKVDDAKSPLQVASEFKTWSDKYHTPFANTMYGDGQGAAAKEQYDNALNYANTAYMTQYAKIGAQNVMSPDGKSALNWAEIARNAADPNFKLLDVEGNVLTVDDPLRKGFITLAREKADAQKNFFNNRRAELEREDEEKFTNRLVGIYQTGVPDENFLKDIKDNKFLQPETKRTFINSYKTATSSGTTKPWDTQEGISASIAVRTLIAMGVLDSNDEKKVLQSLALRGLIKPEEITTLSTKIDDNIKGKTTERQKMFKQVVQTIVKEIGSQDLAEMLKGNRIKSMSNDELLSLITSSKDSDLVLQAIENARLMVEEGEKKGFSLINMMGNRNSKNYIVTPIIEAYKAQKIEDIDAQVRKVMQGGNIDNVPTNFYGSIEGDKFVAPSAGFGTGNNYRIDAGVYFNKDLRKPSASRFARIPPMKENESLKDYLDRVGLLIDATGGSMFSGLNLSSSDVVQVDQ